MTFKAGDKFRFVKQNEYSEDSVYSKIGKDEIFTVNSKGESGFGIYVKENTGLAFFPYEIILIEPLEAAILKTKEKIKMNTRIRYTEVNENELVTRELPAKELIVKASIFLDSMSYTINTTDTNEVVAKGSAPNLAKVKKLVKADLKTLGAVFFDEVRSSKDKETGNEV